MNGRTGGEKGKKRKKEHIDSKGEALNSDMGLWFCGVDLPQGSFLCL